MNVILYCDWLNEGIYLSVDYCWKYQMTYKMAASVEQNYTYSIKSQEKFQYG